MQWTKGITFTKRFLRNPKQTGAVWPSSRYLAQAMVDGIDWSNIRNVVEFGPGDGIFTEHILKHLQPDGRLIAIELNPDFAQPLSARYSHITVCQEDVAHVEQICKRFDMHSVDVIVSGLPWACFGDAKQNEILNATMNVLKPGGQFMTFAYLQGLLLPTGRSFRNQLNAHFDRVEQSRVVWRNMPPAFVYRCQKHV